MTDTHTPTRPTIKVQATCVQCGRPGGKRVLDPAILAPQRPEVVRLHIRCISDRVDAS